MTDTALDARRVPLEGAHNVRDLGGYPSRFGGRVRWGRIYRGDRLDELTDDDVEVLRGLGLAVVFDLRTLDERTAFPDAIPSTHVPLFANSPLTRPDLDTSALTDRDDGVRMMTQVCADLVRHASREIGAILFTLADPRGTPMLFHCTAGKDRTGVVAGIVLEALGVPRDHIFDDFELTERYHRPEAFRTMLERFGRHGLPPEVVIGLHGAPRSIIAGVLDVVDDEFGGIDRYLIERGGVDAEALSSIRRAMLVDTAG
jgi:protein-tyrosine phosphatase